MKTFNEIGTFWVSNFPLPNNSLIVVNGKSIFISENKIRFGGILKKENNKFYLHYEEPNQSYQQSKNFHNMINAFKNQNTKIKDSILIVGQVNEQITLIAFNPSIEIFEVAMIFEGFHFKNFEDIKFKEIILSFTNLDSFIKTENIDKNGQEMYDGSTLIDYLNKNKLDTLNDLNKDKISYQFDLNYQSPKFEKILLDRFELKIAPHFHSKSEKNPRKFCIIEEFKIWLKYYEEEDFLKIQEDIRLLEKFFTLILGQSHLTEVKGKLKIKHRPIKIYTPKILKTSDNKDNRLIQSLFKFEDISNPRLLFKNWFKKYENLKSFFDLYFAPKFSKLYAETEFLLYTQALETYYRKSGDSEYFDETTYNILKRDIKDSINDLYENFTEFDIVDGFKNKFESSIRYAYEKSLRSMLKELLNDLNYKKINEILDNHSMEIERNKKVNGYVGIIVDNRNYYTHYEGKEPNIYNLIDLVKELKCIIEICFMKELGLSKNEINKITENNRFNLDYSYYKTHCNI